MFMIFVGKYLNLIPSMTIHKEWTQFQTIRSCIITEGLWVDIVSDFPGPLIVRTLSLLLSVVDLIFIGSKCKEIILWTS